MSLLGPAHDVSTADVMSVRYSPTGRSRPSSPHNIFRTIDSGTTSISAFTTRIRIACCRCSSVAKVDWM
eukprot:3703856-Pleurochrysis_carterae.AAC.1